MVGTDMEDMGQDTATMLKNLQEALDADPDNPTLHFDIGCSLWKRGEEESSKELLGKAVEHFVTSAKLNPSNGAAFRYIGHYYSRVSLDAQRASKCYQRAVALNPDDSEAGEELCDMLDGDGKESLEVAVCREASERSKKAYWAFRRLGYLQVHRKKWEEAVPSLQHAIRGHPACADLWEALGLAYHRLGMFTAALKSYGRSIELEDSKVFALVESGNILVMLGSFRNGVEKFRRVLELSPDNASACFGLASGLLALAKEWMSSGAFALGASLLEEASDVMKSCCSSVGNVTSSWKLHGDIQIAYARCFPWDNECNNTEIDEYRFKSSIYSWKKTCLSAAITANRSYQRALHLTPWQATAYTDVAISTDLVYSFGDKKMPHVDIWTLPEKMSLGSIMLEGENIDTWIALGCLSHNYALKQHAFIRGLQLDKSLSIAWAYLGKLYRLLGEKKFAKQAFDLARSIDPSLALPWAGMSVEARSRECSAEEAYESCLRAAEILPLADFQLGLGALASLSGHIKSSQVYAAVKQAVQRAPLQPESHNLKGLVCEARSDFPSAIASYRQAKCAGNIFWEKVPEFSIRDVSINLARSLCKAGNAVDAVNECEKLKKEGLLDYKGLQIYTVSLWQLGKNDMALSEARHLAAQVSALDEISRAAALGLLCKLLYCIRGLESAITTILKFPREFLQNSKMSLILHAVSVFEWGSGLQSLLSANGLTLRSHEEASETHYLVALSKMLSDGGSGQSLGIKSAVNHLKRALHIYPNNSTIRTRLGSFLLSSKDWMASHIAAKFVAITIDNSNLKGMKSSQEIMGASAVACNACSTTKQNISYATCRDQNLSMLQDSRELQRWLHQEPWNHKAQYLLILDFLQKAREENFPQHLCRALTRLISTAYSNEIYLQKNQLYEYQKFQLLLCLSEIYLRRGEYLDCVNHATDASKLHVSDRNLFFASLQLCRVYAAQKDWQNLNKQFLNCLRLKTDVEIGWISLKHLECKFKLQSNISSVDADAGQLFGKHCSTNMWAAISDLVLLQIFIHNSDLTHAEQVLRHAYSMCNTDRCLLLCYGAICLELARQQSTSQFLSMALSCLTKARNTTVNPLPLVSALLAQAEASLGSKAKWAKNLRAEWLSWSPERRPAELYFQMHLLAQQPAAPNERANIEFSQCPEKWIVRAIHLNPSSSKYWKVLQKLMAL